MTTAMTAVCLCGATDFEPTFHYDEAPLGEIRFEFSKGQSYSRDVLRCRACGHFVSAHEMDDSALYSEEYVTSTYGDAQSLKATFDKINSLPPSKSDNVGRVRRIVSFAEGFWDGNPIEHPTILDVGSGLCVFLHRMKEYGWKCSAVDPDARAVKHAAETVNVIAIQGDFLKTEELAFYDVVSLNKTLEHVKDPLPMLIKARKVLNRDGFCYIELPDGNAAARDGQGREEFFIDHHHIFSPASLAILAEKAGFDIKLLESVREPSTKYTLRGFLAPKPEGN